MGKVTARKRKLKSGKIKWEWRFEGAKINGERNQMSKGGFNTQKEALEAGNIAYNEYINGNVTTFHPSEISLSDYLDLWLEKYSINLRYKTIKCYAGIIENHLKPKLGKYTLSALNPAMLQDFANDLKVQGYSKRHTVNILSTLKTALNYAIEPLQYIKQNPMNHIKTPKIEKPPKQRIVLTPENWNTIITRFPFGNKYYMPLIIGYYTGLRISEVCALTWNDIDFKKFEINVSKQTIRMDKGKWNFDEPKTESSKRKIKIDKVFAGILKKEKARQAKNKLLYAEHYTYYRLDGKTLVPDKDGDIKPVCVEDSGKLVTTDNFKYCSRVIHHELKLEFDFHSLRHTHATIMFENGVNAKSVQNRLGHKKIQTTLQTYIKETDDMSREAARIFEKAVNKNEGI